MFEQCTCGHLFDMDKDSWWDENGVESIKFVTCPVCDKKYIVRDYEQFLDIAYSNSNENLFSLGCEPFFKKGKLNL